MVTRIRNLRLSDEHWQGLVEVSAGIVPDEAVDPNTGAGKSRVVPMLRMVAEGKLVVVPPDQVKDSNSQAT